MIIMHRFGSPKMQRSALIKFKILNRFLSENKEQKLFHYQLAIFVSTVLCLLEAQIFGVEAKAVFENAKVSFVAKIL